MSVLREDRHASPRPRKVFLPVAPSFARKLNHLPAAHTAGSAADDSLSIDSLADDRRYSDVPSINNFSKFPLSVNTNASPSPINSNTGYVGNYHSKPVSAYSTSVTKKTSAASSSTHASLRFARNSSSGSKLEDDEVSRITKRSGPNPSSSSYYPTKAAATSSTGATATPTVNSSAIAAARKQNNPSPMGSEYEFDVPSIPSFRFTSGLSLNYNANNNSTPNSYGKLPSNNLSSNIIAEALANPSSSGGGGKANSGIYSSRKYQAAPESIGSKVTRSSKNNSNLSSIHPPSFSSKNNSNLTSTTIAGPTSFSSNPAKQNTGARTDRNRRRTRQTSTNARTLTDLSVSSKRTISGVGMDGTAHGNGSKGRKTSNAHSQRTVTDLSARRLSTKGDIYEGNSHSKLSSSRRRLTRPQPVRISPIPQPPSTTVPSPTQPTRSLRKSLRKLIPLSLLRNGHAAGCNTSSADNSQQSKGRSDGRRATEVDHAAAHISTKKDADQSNSMLSKLSLRSRTVKDVRSMTPEREVDNEGCSKRSLRRNGNREEGEGDNNMSQPNSSNNGMRPKSRGLRYRSAGDYSTTVQVLIDRERSNTTSTRSRLDSTATASALAYEQRSYSPFEISPSPSYSTFNGGGHRRTNSGGTMKWVTCLPGTKGHRNNSNNNNNGGSNSNRRSDRSASNNNDDNGNGTFRGEEPHSFAGFRQKPWYLVSEGSSVSSGEWDNNSNDKNERNNSNNNNMRPKYSSRSDTAASATRGAAGNSSSNTYISGKKKSSNNNKNGGSNNNNNKNDAYQANNNNTTASSTLLNNNNNISSGASKKEAKRGNTTTTTRGTTTKYR